MNLFIIFLIVITFFLLLIKLIASLIGRVSERLLTNHFRNLETLLEHDQLPVDWGEKLEKIAQGGGAHILFVRQLLWDEEAKSFLMKKILALYKFFENSPFVESQEARELLLEQLETVINRWEGSEVPEILAYYL